MTSRGPHSSFPTSDAIVKLAADLQADSLSLILKAALFMNCAFSLFIFFEQKVILLSEPLGGSLPGLSSYSFINGQRFRELKLNDYNGKRASNLFPVHPCLTIILVKRVKSLLFKISDVQAQKNDF
jgi:hypothetical protein